MPEFIYDSSVGEAFQIDSRAAKPKEYVESEINPDELEEALINRTARGLSERATRQHTASAGDATQYIESEAKLLDLQRQLSQSNDPIQQRVLEGKITALAEALVSKDPGLTDSKLDEVDEADDFEEYLRNEKNVEEIVNWAAENMPKDFNETFNNRIAESDDQGVQLAGLEFLNTVRTRQEVFQHRWEAQPLSDTHIAGLVDCVGQENADDLVVLSEGVRTGAISTIQAIETVGKSPRLKRALKTAADQGIITHLIA